mmetsp:Transcript_52826/g.150608  ORF Transcript_52826/g.150608 Transcript_52826/m.150608 type:complete len:204 (+) Transcript_52826:407-1018(+)
MSRSSSRLFLFFLPASSRRWSRSISRCRSLSTSMRWRRSSASFALSPSCAGMVPSSARCCRACVARSRSCCSRSSSSRTFFCRIMSFLILISSRALRSARYRSSLRAANLSFTATSCRLRPSAARRLSSGMVKPFEFFQLETQGGTFQSFWSFAVSFFAGEWCTGGGGDGGPLGTFLCLNLGGCMGSTCFSTSLITRSRQLGV